MAKDSITAAYDAVPSDRPSLAEMVTEAQAKPGTLRVAPRGQTEILFARFFAAPQAAVFAAWTTPDLIRQWLTPAGWTMATCTIDLRAGGLYRFVMEGQEGAIMAWGGTYTQVASPATFSATERFDEAWYPGEAYVEVVLHKVAGGTVATMLLTYESLDARDTVLRSPLDAGLAEGFKGLAALVEAPRDAARPR